jgi:hypothetical protein
MLPKPAELPKARWMPASQVLMLIPVPERVFEHTLR